MLVTTECILAYRWTVHFFEIYIVTVKTYLYLNFNWQNETHTLIDGFLYILLNVLSSRRRMEINAGLIASLVHSVEGNISLM